MAAAGAAAPRFTLAALLLAFGTDVCWSATASAQVPLHRLEQLHPKFASRVLSPRLNAGKAPRLVVPSSAARGSADFVRVSEEFVVVPAEWHASFAGAKWSPPKRLLLDEVRHWINIDGYVEAITSQSNDAEAGLGRDVTIGIVDGGIDLRHPDLRNDDGTTRAAWLLDFASPPLGLNPELEQEYGCTNAASPCAVLSAADIDLVLSDSQTPLTLPLDRLGHGTHVASIAAGNGRASGKYRGIAPKATLIAARLAVDSVEVQDADVLLASRFVFERAAAMGQPAVVNLSLGGDFGPHDGSTMLERALVSLLDVPGRAMVVAAGNSGRLSDEEVDGLDGPFGIHTELRVEGTRDVPIVLPRGRGPFEGDILIWLDTRPGESLSVGVKSGRKTIVDLVAAGNSAEGSAPRWDALVSNRTPLDETLEDLEGGTLVLLTGEFDEQEVILLELAGEAKASLWLQGAGELAPGSGTDGPAFALARQGGTITVPATAPELIAVGATLNRNAWPSRTEGIARLPLFSEQLDETPGSVAFFSSVGPNHNGRAKPDVLAPGAVVVAAMAPSADPMPAGALANAVSMFGASAACEEEPTCAVVDAQYAMAVGTSMAAPVVAGAAALLLEQNPQLTQAEVRSLLAAGVSRQSTSKVTQSWERALVAGSGALELERTGQALELAMEPPRDAPELDADNSWLTFADAYVAPGETIEVQFWARTEEDTPAAVAPELLEVVASGAARVGDVEQLGPGLFRCAIRAATGVSTQRHLEVTLRWDDTPVARASVPIARDITDVRGLYPGTPGQLTKESCALSQTSARDVPWLGMATGSLGLFFFVRRRQSACGSKR